jgi:ABC-type Fe3+/spermidine/putrescine transport system ATPase subunit
LINGEDITDFPPNKRAINTVFQNYALFPCMSMYENIAFGLQMQKKSKDQILAAE